GVVVTAAITAGGGTLGGVTQVTTGSNVAATFADLFIAGVAGPRTLTFSAGGVTGVAATVTTTAGAARTIAVNAGNNQSAFTEAAVAIAPSVRVADLDGNAVSGVAVQFQVAGGGGGLTGASAATDNAGLAAVGSWTLGAATGTNSLTA